MWTFVLKACEQAAGQRQMLMIEGGALVTRAEEAGSTVSHRETMTQIMRDALAHLELEKTALQVEVATSSKKMEGKCSKQGVDEHTTTAPR